MIQSAASIFPANVQAAKVTQIQDRIKALKAETITLTALKTLLKTATRAIMDATYPTMVEPERGEMGGDGDRQGRDAGGESSRASSPARNTGCSSKTAMRKMGITGDAHQEKVKKDVLE